MPPDQAWLRFVVAALATWRVTHLIVHEDGPWDVVVRLRRAAGSGFWGRLMDCFYCSSLWISAGFAFFMRPNLEQWFLYWLALSAAACVIDRIGRDPVIIQTGGQGGTDDAVLRTEPGAGEDRDSGEAGSATAG